MPRSHLSINLSVITQIKIYCQQLFPNQAYGILAGTTHHITHFFPITNLNPSCCSFEFEPREYLETIKKLRALNLDWIGMIHSHPFNEAYPTIRDLKQWCYGEKSCWIMSLREKEVHLCAYYIQLNQQVTSIIYEIL
jgi:proteasome lid subunit RPN8/RPN11